MQGVYGSAPNAAGAAKYARDAAVASAVPYYRDILRTLQSPLAGHKGQFILRLLPFIILFCALGLAALTLLTAAQRSAGYGMTSVLVDEDKLTTAFTASVDSVWQQWAFRVGQPGPGSQASTPSQGTGVKFTLPNASTAKEGAVVVVRNTNAPYWKSADRSSGSNIQAPLQVTLIAGDGTEAQETVPNASNTAANDTNASTVLQARAWIAATGFDGVRRWYPAGLPIM